MNEELMIIKEILDNFEKYETRYRLHNETQFIITHREIQILLDYITNLQEENKQLKELCDKYEEEPQEHKIPEKICTNRIINTKDILEFEMIQNKINAEYTYVINEIIDYLEEIKKMSKEDKKLQKHLVDEMMKVYETNPNVMIYMQSLMENYEKLEQENKQLKEELETILDFDYFKNECPLNIGFGDELENKAQDVFYEDEYCESCKDDYKTCWLKYFKKLQELKEKYK